jgi:hypothetical protein
VELEPRTPPNVGQSHDADVLFLHDRDGHRFQLGVTGDFRFMGGGKSPRLLIVSLSSHFLFTASGQSSIPIWLNGRPPQSSH